MANLLIIKELLKQRKKTIRDFASEIGMTEQALQLLIRKNSTKIETLELIAKKLNVSISIFFEDNIEGTEASTSLFTKQVLNDGAKIFAKVIDDAVKEKNELIDAKNQIIYRMDEIIQFLRSENMQKDKTIDELKSLVENLKKGIALEEENASCAIASGSDLVE